MSEVAEESHNDNFEKEFFELTEETEEVNNKPIDEPEKSDGIDEEVEKTPENNEIEKEVDWQSQIKDLQERNAELEHSFKSNAGRVSALQKKINEYEEQLNQDQELIENKNDSIVEFEEDYPDIAESVKAMLDKQEKQWQDKFDKEFSSVREAEQKRYNESQVAELANEFPNWNEIEQSQEFGKWITTQPEPVKQMFSSQRAVDHSYLLNSFIQQKSQKADSLTAKRERKLKSSVALPNKGASKKSQAPDDFEAAFEYYTRTG